MELAHTHRRHARRPGRAGRPAAGDLPRPANAVRRRLRRLLERARRARVARVDDGVAVVETDLGEVAASPPTASRPGGASSSICRPERTRLAREEPRRRTAGAPRSGRPPSSAPTSSTSCGSASTPSASGASTRRCWSAGTEVWLYVEPEHVRVLPLCRNERLRPARARDVRQLPRGVRRAPAALPRRAQRRLQRLLGADALRRRRRGGERSATFTTTVQNVVPKVAFTGRRPPLHLDPPEHTPYRTALNPYFTAEKMRRLEPRLREIIGGLLEPLVDAGGGRHLRGLQLPAAGLRLRGVLQPARRSSACASATPRASSTSPSRTSSRRRSSARASSSTTSRARSSPCARRSRSTPRTTPRAGLLATGLPEDMLLGTIRQFIVVGMIAPSVFIGSMVIHLAEHEDVQQQLRSDAVAHPRGGRRVPATADAVSRLRADSDARRRRPRAADPQGRAGRGRVRLGEPRRGRLPRPRPLHSRPPEHPPPPRLRDRAAPLRRGAARPAHAARSRSRSCSGVHLARSRSWASRR